MGEKTGRKTKKTEILQRLDEVKKLAKAGFAEKDIATYLGIGKTVFYELKKESSEFAEALKQGREGAIKELEAASFKAAMGYEYEEEKTIIQLDETGQATKRVKEVTKKHQPSNPAMLQYLLNNWTKGDYTKDPTAMRFREEELKLKKDAAKYTNF